MDNPLAEDRTRKPYMTWAGIMFAAAILFSATAFQLLSGICVLLFLLFAIIGLADKYVTNRGVPVRKDRALNIFANVLGGATILTILLQLLIPAINSVRIAAEQARQVKAGGYTVPSDKEAQAFAQQMQRELDAKDLQNIFALCDFDQLVRDAIAGINVPTNIRAEFIKRHADQLLKSYSRLFQDASLRLLKVQNDNGQQKAFFRVLTDSDDLTYFAFILGKNENGNTKAIDFFSYSTGEKLSEGARHMFLSVISEPGKGQSQYRNAVIALGKEMERNDFKRFSEIYSQLPNDIKKKRIIQNLRVRAASQLQDMEAFKQALAESITYFPGDPSTALAAMDLHAINKDYQAAVDSLDLLDASIGPDPYLNSRRADFLFSNGEMGKAMDAAKQYAQDFPDDINSYYRVLQTSLANKDFEETANMLIKLEALFNVEIKDLYEIPGFSEFVKSPAHSKWQDSREAE